MKEAPESARADVWEYPQASGILIRRVANRNSTEGLNRLFGHSFLVTIPGKLTGKGRCRRQFPTQEAAENWAKEQVAGTRQLGEAFFELDPLERRDAVTALDLLRPHGLSIKDVAQTYLKAFEILKPLGIDLVEAVRFATPRIKPPGGDRTVQAVVDEMVVSKENRFRTRQLRDRSLADFKTRSQRFADTFGDRLIKEIAHDAIKAWILSMKLSARSNKNYLACLSEIFRFAKQKRYVSVSPFEDFADDDLKEMKGNDGERSEPNILSIDQARMLLETALQNPDLGLLGAVTLALFCGIRTAELMKLDWQHVNLNWENPEESFVTIPKAIAKKRKIRNVTIPKIALAWLARCPARSGPLADNKYSSDYRKRFLKLQKQAGFGIKDESGKWRSTWEENNMRHSFGTYHFALHGNSMETARLLGHAATDHVLFEHYRALARREDAERYFSLTPPGQPLENVTIPRV